ncbi:hypothetical protein F4781DRAFT_443441 [Annulohypoxylon bovei var. microspora]|nr:hypothetical protein F4781DRAFT_443441 [Annulohypoxylon bovei var. microspora]
MDNQPPKAPLLARATPVPPQSGYSRPPSFRPSCTHLTMTRLYDPNLGWLWRCTTDRELLIEDAISKGRPVSFDLISASFAGNLGVRPRSPESRSDKLSFFSEITPEQFRSYTPDQIRIILEQREHVLNVASEASSSTEPPPGFEYMKSTKAWIPAEYEECQFKCCVTCRPSATSRSYLNIDEVVNDAIPPTTAIGFSFQRCGRPIIHPSRLENIGLRPVLWPRAYASTINSSAYSLETSGCSSLEGETIAETEHMEPVKSQDSQSSNGNSTIESVMTEEHQLSDATLPPWPRAPGSSKEITKSILFAAACLTPLPPTLPEEQAALREHTTKMMEEEMEEGKFHKEPLEVDHGVAFSEEAVGLGVADVVTQA